MKKNNNEQQIDTPKQNVPLYSEHVVKEYKSMEDVFKNSDITNHCVIPGLKDVDFAVRVQGNGMYPKYSNGDMIVCRVVKDSFIQWGKVYNILTKNGFIVRKLKPSANENCVMAETYSEDYPPFDIPKDEIIGLAIVVASIKFE